MLNIEALSVWYGGFCAVSEISLRVEAGETVAMVGANGAGKTTIMNAILGLVRYSARAVRFEDRNLQGLSTSQIVETGIALVPEHRRLFPNMTVKENLYLGAYTRRARQRAAQTFAEVCETFPRLGERSHQKVGTMSGGEQQMVAVGRALMSRPKLVILDEPSLGLSPLMVQRLFVSLATVKQTGVALLLVEQNTQRALHMASRAYVVENGHIAAAGRSQDLMEDPVVKKAYLGL